MDRDQQRVRRPKWTAIHRNECVNWSQETPATVTTKGANIGVIDQAVRPIAGQVVKELSILFLDPYLEAVEFYISLYNYSDLQSCLDDHENGGTEPLLAFVLENGPLRLRTLLSTQPLLVSNQYQLSLLTSVLSVAKNTLNSPIELAEDPALNLTHSIKILISLLESEHLLSETPSRIVGEWQGQFSPLTQPAYDRCTLTAA